MKNQKTTKSWIKLLSYSIEANSFVFSIPRWKAFLVHPFLCIEMAIQFKEWEEFVQKKKRGQKNEEPKNK